MTQDDIDLLIGAMRAHGVTRLEWANTRRGSRLSLSLPADAAAPAPPPPVPALAVTSPGIGRFEPRGGDDGLPALTAGDAVRAGEPLGYIAQGAVRQPLIAPAAGRPGPLPEPGRVFGHGDRVAELERRPA
jgi:hypothetical protein